MLYPGDVRDLCWPLTNTHWCFHQVLCFLLTRKNKHTLMFSPVDRRVFCLPNKHTHWCFHQVMWESSVDQTNTHIDVFTRWCESSVDQNKHTHWCFHQVMWVFYWPNKHTHWCFHRVMWESSVDKRNTRYFHQVIGVFCWPSTHIDVFTRWCESPLLTKATQNFHQVIGESSVDQAHTLMFSPCDMRVLCWPK